MGVSLNGGFPQQPLVFELEKTLTTKIYWNLGPGALSAAPSTESVHRQREK